MPSTFADHHDGDQHATYISPDGQHETRIDYVVVPRDLNYMTLGTTVDLDIDLSINRTDHLAVKCEVSFQRTSAEIKSHNQYKLTFNRNELNRRLQEDQVQWQLHEQHPLPPWNVDPHVSAEILTQQTQCFIAELAPQRHHHRRKHLITEQTWALVDEKKATFKQLRRMQYVRAFTVLQTIFRAWKGQFCGTEVRSWLKLHDHATAQTTQRLGKLSRRVTQAVRAEDAAF